MNPYSILVLRCDERNEVHINFPINTTATTGIGTYIGRDIGGSKQTPTITMSKDESAMLAELLSTSLGLTPKAPTIDDDAVLDDLATNITLLTASCQPDDPVGEKVKADCNEALGLITRLRGLLKKIPY